ncbi:hypothetical protein F5Y01DRAFT_219960 [Xylaria sp. FL0043]|nr:hypothetical protein F5Y01DRAFT_219960 [Xylaria sp. FL0043]
MVGDLSAYVSDAAPTQHKSRNRTGISRKFDAYGVSSMLSPHSRLHHRPQQKASLRYTAKRGLKVVFKKRIIAQQWNGSESGEIEKTSEYAAFCTKYSKLLKGPDRSFIKRIEQLLEIPTSYPHWMFRFKHADHPMRSEHN